MGWLSSPVWTTATRARAQEHFDSGAWNVRSPDSSRSRLLIQHVLPEGACIDAASSGKCPRLQASGTPEIGWNSLGRGKRTAPIIARRKVAGNNIRAGCVTAQKPAGVALQVTGFPRRFRRRGGAPCRPAAKTFFCEGAHRGSPIPDPPFLNSPLGADSGGIATPSELGEGEGLGDFPGRPRGGFLNVSTDFLPKETCR